MTGPRAADRSFFGHPRGLAVLAFTEGWVGFSFYGMQSLLVLYLTGQVLRAGHVAHVFGFGPLQAALGLLYGPLAGQPLASAILGLYSALVFATPILGGVVADRLLGRTRTIILGAVLMTVGHFLMAFEASLLVALVCLLCGIGCAGSTKAQVGGLYAAADPRRTDAFQIYTLSVNVAVILAPLVCGTLGERVAWHWGFAAAGAGMLVGLMVYLGGLRWLPDEPPVARGARAARQVVRDEWRRLAVLAMLLPVLAVASVGNMEIFNGYLLWGRLHYDLVWFGRTMPVTWLLSLDAFVSTAALLLSVLFWRWWARLRGDPGEIVKLVVGAAISAAAPLILAAASWHAGAGKAGLGWAVGFHVVNGVGFANLYAVGLALYSRAAPAGLGATVVNAFALHLFLANLLTGWLAGLLARLQPTQFWLLHSALAAGAAMVLLLLRGTLERVLNERILKAKP